jgi:hypothetical protein
MLNEYSSDVDINKNLRKLRELQPVFDSFVVDIDGGFNAASADGKKQLQTYLQKISEISKMIVSIRADIIS